MIRVGDVSKIAIQVEPLFRADGVLYGRFGLWINGNLLIKSNDDAVHLTGCYNHVLHDLQNLDEFNTKQDLIECSPLDTWMRIYEWRYLDWRKAPKLKPISIDDMCMTGLDIYLVVYIQGFNSERIVAREIPIADNELYYIDLEKGYFKRVLNEFLLKMEPIVHEASTDTEYEEFGIK